MKTKLIDEERIVKRIDGFFVKSEVELYGTCYFTNRRLIFEEFGRGEKPEVKINWKKLAKRSLIGGILGGPIGGGLGGASSVEVKPGGKVSEEIVFWLHDLENIEFDDTGFKATSQEDEEILFGYELPSDRFTNEEQERVTALIATAKDKTKT